MQFAPKIKKSRMNIMKKYIFIIISICCYCVQSYGQHILKATFDNVNCDSLTCKMTIENAEPLAYIGSYDQNCNSWFFQIPDSIFEQYQSMRFVGKCNNTPESSMLFGFRIMEKDSMQYTESLFWEDTDTLLLQTQFVERDTIRQQNIFNGREVIIQMFNLINPSPEQRISVKSANDMYKKYRNITQDQAYTVFHDMFSQAKDSRTNIFLLYENRGRFTIEQLQSLKSLFSETMQNSYCGRKLDKYIKIFSDKFKDTWLTNCLTEKKEQIVTNEDKHTLLVFSASWCAPCHKLIPLLKELYLKKKEVMDIVYITLDRPEELPTWIKLMEEHDIPWRSLTTDGKIKEIRDKYNVPVIPYTYLIYPHRAKTQKVELRRETDKIKLENL